MIVSSDRGAAVIERKGIEIGRDRAKVRLEEMTKKM
jgi:hypothetical protein